MIGVRNAVKVFQLQVEVELIFFIQRHNAKVHSAAPQINCFGAHRNGRKYVLVGRNSGFAAVFVSVSLRCGVRGGGIDDAVFAQKVKRSLVQNELPDLSGRFDLDRFEIEFVRNNGAPAVKRHGAEAEKLALLREKKGIESVAFCLNNFAFKLIFTVNTAVFCAFRNVLGQLERHGSADIIEPVAFSYTEVRSDKAYFFGKVHFQQERFPDVGSRLKSAFQAVKKPAVIFRDLRVALFVVGQVLIEAFAKEGFALCGEKDFERGIGSVNAQLPDAVRKQKFVFFDGNGGRSLRNGRCLL